MTPATRLYRAPLRSRLGGVFFILPGVVWLAVFFLVPLVLIFIVSLGTRDASGHIILTNPKFPGVTLSIPNHKEVRLPLLHAQIKRAGMTDKEYRSQYDLL